MRNHVIQAARAAGSIGICAELQATFTPFQNATRSVIYAAAGLGVS